MHLREAIELSEQTKRYIDAGYLPSELVREVRQSDLDGEVIALVPGRRISRWRLWFRRTTGWFI
jgi:hypothetical protein